MMNMVNTRKHADEFEAQKRAQQQASGASGKFGRVLEVQCRDLYSWRRVRSWYSSDYQGIFGQ